MAPDNKDERLSLRISSDLKKKAQEWADRHNVTLSSVVTRFFQNLLSGESKKEHEVR